MHKNILSMKTKAICSIFVLFAIAAVMVSSTPAAFADHSEVTIVTGSVPLSIPGCEETNECYTPSNATVDVGGVVTMTNIDVALHTFTSGTTEGFEFAPDSIFDSGYLYEDGSFEWIPDTAGEYPYYCTAHPWMIGTIIVQEAEAAEEETHDDMEDPHMDGDMKDTHGDDMKDDDHMGDVMDDGMKDDDHMGDVMDDGMKDDDHMEDVELMVAITDSAVLGGTQVDLEFSELHVNYEIIATQNDEEIYKKTMHSMELTQSHQIDALGSDENPIDVEIVSLGIGHPDADPADWTGPKDSVVATMQVVPEFGTIAMMILAVAIISIVAVTAKSRVVPRF